MSSIQGITGVGAAASAAHATPKAQAIPAAKAEVQETAQDERKEVSRGAQEQSERQTTQVANPNLGTRLNITA